MTERFTKPTRRAAPEAAGPHPAVMPASPDATGLRDIFALVRGNLLLILFMVLLSLGAGAAYLAFAPPRYIASATLLVDPSSSSIPEEYYIESQTQMMRSDLVVRTVIEQLDLVEAGIEEDDRTLLRDHARAAKRLVAGFVPALASDPEDGDPLQGAVSTLRRNLTITRPAMTPAIFIAYNSTDPRRAADVVNTLIQAYASQRQRDETAAKQQSIEWLTRRLDDLRRQLERAERSVESFRMANSIVGTGANHNVQAEQRLYELSMQLEAARAATDRARARYGSMQDMSESAPGAAMRATPAGGEIAMLSGREPAAEGPAGFRPDFETDVLRPDLPAAGPAGPDAGKAEEQQGEAGARDELEDALRSQASLEEAFDAAARRAGEANGQRSRLRELESSAEIYRTLYANMLQRYEEAVQQGSLPVNDNAQVLIAARRPDGRSHPRPPLVLAFAGAFGAALGIGAAVVRVRLSNSKAVGK